jgi:hypothetical protein
MSRTSVRPEPRGGVPRPEPETGAREAPTGVVREPVMPGGAGVRGAIDALVQAALVDLFQGYRVPLAPLPRSALRRLAIATEVSAAISFSSSARSSSHGRLTLSIPTAVLEQMTDNSTTQIRHADWTRELANQLLGRIKNRLLMFSVRLTAGLPSNLEPKVLEAQLNDSKALRIYVGRTLRGQVLATLEGLPNESELAYVGSDCVAVEGDAILF